MIMPTASVANFENDDLLSSRLLSFMASADQMPIGYEPPSTNCDKFVNTASFGTSARPLNEMDMGGNNIPSNLHRNGTNMTNVALYDQILNGSPSENITPANGYLSGSCTPPLSSIQQASSAQASYLQMRNNVAPPYSALVSPCMNNKNPGANVQQLFGVPNEYHSLQNSPFYNHYQMNGNLSSTMHRPLDGISPGPSVHNGVSPLTGNSRTALYPDMSYQINGGIRTINPNNSTCPQRELFPVGTQNGTHCGSNVFGSGLLMQDRLHYYALAQKHGFIVGAELERVKENSCRSTSQSYGRIAAHFRHRYGETEAKTKATYLQIGVRVPSKDHVSEIVGKGGQKIKLIREETGALITTPGEHEEHVFIIEAPPEIAMRVAHHLTARAHEITQSKLAAGERRRGSTSSQASNAFDSNTNVGFSANNGSTTSLLANCASSTGLHVLSNSAANSPLHPSVGALSTTGNVNISNFRNQSVGSLFTPQLSSLPSSPCNSGVMQTNGNSLFLGSNTSGSRILLARSRISVPQDMVGKIIGTQGSIITTIQKDTGTEIKSPPKEAARGPNATSEFEISAYQGLGLTSNQAAECRVQQAKQLIGHLVMRQLERRASEEVDEASGSSDEQRHMSGGQSSSVKSATWMWPDVAQMDSKEAREVLDRILAESKNKTRRAKELAAAAGGSAGPSPTSNCPNGSILNLSGSLLPVGVLNSDTFGNPTMFETLETNECAELSARNMTEMNTGNLFNQTARFVRRNSSGTLLEENPSARVSHQNCSPRTLTNYALPDSFDLMGSYQRVTPNRVNDIWGSVDSPLTQRNRSSCEQNLYNGYANTTSHVNLFNLTHSSGIDAPTLRKQTSLNNGLSALKSNSDESQAIFNFSDATNNASSGFSSGEDLSPNTLLQTNTHVPPDMVSQPLARRHSDWVVPTELSVLRTARSSVTSCLPSTVDAFSPSGSFDFLKALDQLCLNPNPNEGIITESLGSRTNSSSGSHGRLNSLLSHCPPGFEPLTNSLNENAFSSAEFEGPADFNDLCAAAAAAAGSWSGLGTDAASLFLPSSSEHATSSHSGTKVSVLQRIFHNNPVSEASLSTTHLNSIWSPSLDLNANIPSRTDFSDSFTSYFNPSALVSDDRETDKCTDSTHCPSSESINQNGDSMSKCGTIGEGRRRRHGQSPDSSPDKTDSVVPLSVSSTILNSITEVA